MSSRPRPDGFLMHDSWRADIVLARRLELGGGVLAARTGRRRVSEMLRQRLDEQDLHDVEVLVSEIVTNAVRHGRAGPDDTIVVHVAMSSDCLRVEVCDQGPGFTPPRSPCTRADGGGNGLLLLDRLSSAWGVAGDDGTCVWFERVLGPAAA
jgi:anti-sigma regulatory factor (Ser/Thr protein kinase)